MRPPSRIARILRAPVRLSASLRDDVEDPRKRAHVWCPFAEDCVMLTLVHLSCAIKWTEQDTFSIKKQLCSSAHPFALEAPFLVLSQSREDKAPPAKQHSYLVSTTMHARHFAAELAENETSKTRGWRSVPVGSQPSPTRVCMCPSSRALFLDHVRPDGRRGSAREETPECATREVGRPRRRAQSARMCRSTDLVVSRCRAVMSLHHP